MYVRWEYKVWPESEQDGVMSFFEEGLNKLGSEGWELMTLKVGGSLFFKRPNRAWLKAERARMGKAADRLRKMEPPRSEIFTTADACCREDPERRKLEVS